MIGHFWQLSASTTASKRINEEEPNQRKVRKNTPEQSRPWRDECYPVPAVEVSIRPTSQSKVVKEIDSEPELRLAVRTFASIEDEEEDIHKRLAAEVRPEWWRELVSWEGTN